MHHQNGLKSYQFFFMTRYAQYVLHTKNGNQIWWFVLTLKHTVSN